MVSIICYFVLEWLRYFDDKSKNLNFDHYFLIFIFYKTIQYTAFKFCLPILRIHMEGTVSQISYLGPSFYFMPKIGKQCEKFRKNIFYIT